jgi:phosphoenolpyruvate carboxykinase (ATP)
MVSAVLSGQLKDIKTEIDPIFGVSIPINCPGVPEGVLNPRKTWKSPDAYDKKASQLAKMFNENFKEYEENAPLEVRAANPRI